MAPTATQAKILSNAYAHGGTLNDGTGPAIKRYLALVHTKSSRARELFHGGPDNVTRTGSKLRVKLELHIGEDGLVSPSSEAVLSDFEAQKKLKRQKTAMTDLEVLGVSVSSTFILWQQQETNHVEASLPRRPPRPTIIHRRQASTACHLGFFLQG